MLDGVVIPAAATVTATSALATAGFTRAIYHGVKRHDRVLFGEEEIEEWNGIVAEVKRNREALTEEDLR